MEETLIEIISTWKNLGISPIEVKKGQVLYSGVRINQKVDDILAAIKGRTSVWFSEGSYYAGLYGYTEESPIREIIKVKTKRDLTFLKFPSWFHPADAVIQNGDIKEIETFRNPIQKDNVYLGGKRADHFVDENWNTLVQRLQLDETIHGHLRFSGAKELGKNIGDISELSIFNIDDIELLERAELPYDVQDYKDLINKNYHEAEKILF